MIGVLEGKTQLISWEEHSVAMGIKKIKVVKDSRQFCMEVVSFIKFAANCTQGLYMGVSHRIIIKGSDKDTKGGVRVRLE